MFWPVLTLLSIQCAAVAAQSSSFIDASTGITFQRVETSTDGSSVAIALPPQGTSASDAIIQLTGPASRSFVGVSTSNSLIHTLLDCCWCCTAENNRRSTHRGFRRPQSGVRHLIPGAVASGPNDLLEPIVTHIVEPEITASTFKFTFRCQNCTFSKSEDGKSTTLTTVGSNNEVTSISDPNLQFNPATDDLQSAVFNIDDAKFDGYWSFID